jgi:hypothetical protein
MPDDELNDYSVRALYRPGRNVRPAIGGGAPQDPTEQKELVDFYRRNLGMTLEQSEAAVRGMSMFDRAVADIENRLSTKSLFACEYNPLPIGGR